MTELINTFSWSISARAHCGKDYEFYALREIEPGEELTADYTIYSELPHADGSADKKAVTC